MRKIKYNLSIFMGLDKLLLALLLVFFVAPCFAIEAGDYTFYILFETCRNDTVSVGDWGVEKEEMMVGEIPEGNYSLLFLSSDDKTLFQYGFSLEFLTHGEEVDPETGNLREKRVELECIEKYFMMPYYEDTARFSILKGDETIYTQYFCNENGLCEIEFGETTRNCQDCGSQTKPDANNGSTSSGCKNLCGDGNCDKVVCQGVGCPCAENEINCPEDCPEGSPGGGEKGGTSVWVYLIILAVLAAAVFLAFGRKKRKAGESEWRAAYEGTA